MNLTDVKATPTKRKRRKRVGCGTGSGHGKTSTRGHKGQRSRSGFGGRILDQGGQMPLFRRLPKRGFNNANFKKQYAIVNVGDLNGFEPGSTVNPDAMAKAGLFKKGLDGVKVLGGGEIKIALTVAASKFSTSAVRKIQKAGGNVQEI
ncbi:MAG: 50S ribosomal protein L15 [Planctomycetes bacterium]|nr:50S ribosomal protein L15 [Planctomycetota bacterium]